MTETFRNLGVPKVKFEEFKTLDELREWAVENGKCDRRHFGAWAGRNIPQETGYYQKKILDWLRSEIKNGRLKARVWKSQAGPYQQQGIPDICCIVKGGRFFGFEVKRRFLGSPTTLQENFIREVNGLGGVAIVVSTITEVAEALYKAGIWPEVKNERSFYISDIGT